MKFLIQVILIALLSLLLQSFLPWWTMAVGAFIVGLLFQENGYKSFLAGLLGVGLLWFAAAYFIDASSDSILSVRVAGILPTKTVGTLLIVTALVGGLVGGLATMTGGIISSRPKKKY